MTPILFRTDTQYTFSTTHSQNTIFEVEKSLENFEYGIKDTQQNTTIQFYNNYISKLEIWSSQVTYITYSVLRTAYTLKFKSSSTQKFFIFLCPT